MCCNIQYLPWKSKPTRDDKRWGKRVLVGGLNYNLVMAFSIGELESSLYSIYKGYATLSPASSLIHFSPCRIGLMGRGEKPMAWKLMHEMEVIKKKKSK